MYKQIFKKEDGTPSLIEGDEFNSDIYTDIQPPNGLYQPIHFDGNEWIGTPYEDWKKNQPEIEEEIIIDEKDKIIAELSLQLLETQSFLSQLQNDVANLTIKILESE